MYKIIADFGDYQVIDERIQTFNTEREPRTVWNEDYNWRGKEVITLSFWDMFWNAATVTGMLIMIITFIVSMVIFHM